MEKENYLTTIEVEDVFYVVTDNGKIEVNIKTNHPKFKNIKQSRFKDIHIDVDIIYVKDKFDIYENSNSRELYLKYKQHSESAIDDYCRKCISISRKPVICPCCGSHLQDYTKNELVPEIYCNNSLCSAKLFFTIKKYLTIAANEIEWTYADFNIVAILIDYQIINSVADLYTVFEIDLDTIYYDLIRNTYGSEISYDQLKLFVENLNKTKGQITIYNYIQSLNINHQRDWYIDKFKLCDTFKKLEEILDWLLHIAWIDNEEEFQYYIRESVEPVMSVSTMAQLIEYFNNEDNLDDTNRLLDYSIIKDNEEIINALISEESVNL